MSEECVKTCMKRLVSLPSGYRTAESLKAAQKEIAASLRSKPWIDTYAERVIGHYIAKYGEQGFPTTAQLEQAADEVPQYDSAARDCGRCKGDGMIHVKVRRFTRTHRDGYKTRHTEVIGEFELRNRQTPEDEHSAMQFCGCPFGVAKKQAWNEFGGRA